MIAPDFSFAPIGLLNMFNCGGAVEQFDIRYEDKKAEQSRDYEEANAPVLLKVRGCGRFGAYSSKKPIKCTLDSYEMEFNYDSITGLMTIEIPVPEKEMYQWTLEIQV